MIIENDCRSCQYFDDATQKCGIKEGSPVRRCIIGINKIFSQYIEAGAEILEIGCGSWSFLKDLLINSVNWYGIDVINSDIVTKVGSVGKIPYQSEKFDYVISNQSMEHWYEYGVPLQRGLSEISRVLKKGGEAWLNVPIHHHGHYIFVQGNTENIKRLIEEKYWDIIKIEEWRKNYHPLKPYRPYKNSNRLNNVFPNNPSIWIMNIIIKKKNTQPIKKKTYLKYIFNSVLTDLLINQHLIPNYHYILNTFRIYKSKINAIKEIYSKIPQFIQKLSLVISKMKFR